MLNKAYVMSDKRTLTASAEHAGAAEHPGAIDSADLWQKFHTQVYGFARRRVSSDAAAQDILQNAFLNAHKYLLKEQGAPHNPRAWIYQIARNLIGDTARHDERQQRLARAVAHEPTEASARDVRDDPSDVFTIVAEALPMFIDQLKVPYRDALRMTELEGLTQAAAAARASISLSGMKSRVQRGREHVLALLQRCCTFEVDARGHMIACTPRGKKDSCCGT